MGYPGHEIMWEMGDVESVIQKRGFLQMTSVVSRARFVGNPEVPSPPNARSQLQHDAIQSATSLMGEIPIPRLGGGILFHREWVSMAFALMKENTLSWPLRFVTIACGAISAFVQGSGNFLRALHLPEAFAVALMGVFVASFAATTMDTACQLQRYVTLELAEALGLRMLMGKHASTLLAITLAAVIASMPAPGAPWEFSNLGKGGLFQGPTAWITGDQPNYLLTAVAVVTLVLEGWIIIEAIKAWPRAKGVLEESNMNS